MHRLVILLFDTDIDDYHRRSLKQAAISVLVKEDIAFGQNITSFCTSIPINQSRFCTQQ